VESGLSVDEFWKLTPREVDIYVRAELRRRQYRREEVLYGAWHVALFERQKILPRLESLFGRREESEHQVREQTPEDIYQWAVAFAKTHGKILKKGESPSPNQSEP
jgi:hypothetical protein